MKTTNTSGAITAATSAQPAEKKKTPANLMGAIVNAESTKQLLKNVLADNAGAFAASVIDLYSSDSYLKQCAPQAVFAECRKAATLKLPINKQLGFAYVIAYKGEPQFQIGYKGLIQLALRTGAYRYINAGEVYEGEVKSVDKLTGEVDLSGAATSDSVIGYFAYIETTNGFKKALYWTTEQVISHAKKFSKNYNPTKGVWAEHFDAMAKKTVLRNLLTHYGYMSIEMANAFEVEENTKAAAQAMTEEQPERVPASAEISDMPQETEAAAMYADAPEEDPLA